MRIGYLPLSLLRLLGRGLSFALCWRNHLHIGLISLDVLVLDRLPLPLRGLLDHLYV